MMCCGAPIFLDKLSIEYVHYVSEATPKHKDLIFTTLPRKIRPGVWHDILCDAHRLLIDSYTF